MVNNNSTSDTTDEIVQPSERIEVQPLSDSFTESTYTDNQGRRLRYKTYLPSEYDEDTDIPLVVMLHGGNQNPDDFAVGTRMNDIGERETFAVVYPEQTQKRNLGRYWNWFYKRASTREGADSTRHEEDHLSHLLEPDQNEETQRALETLLREEVVSDEEAEGILEEFLRNEDVSGEETQRVLEAFLFHQREDVPEAALIAGMTRKVINDHSVDEDRVYIAGLSAGGAMAANLGVEYADLYTAAGIHAGLGYDAANFNSGLPYLGQASLATYIMRNGTLYNPQAKGRQAYEAMRHYGSARVVPIIVFHGNRDETVDPEHGVRAAEQATQMNDLADDNEDNESIDFRTEKVTNGQVSGGYKFTRSEYHDPHGHPVVIKYMVDMLGHAWSGGDSSKQYFDSRGPDASQLMWDFFESHTKRE